ncbi:hypothetical protein N825_03110 [Skermanella stibiiresistens SB22]|uniref:Uncharacterized protein n=1 Tax=Skermanella stibiiresistens SB22 TaxID=1385369 RepID=W9H5T3_9PROT|nr:hypothetical protein [Skermanella stibiiresistens]EWY40126.1 hypothetical protein N825_03110 [Skermanella stibiiresistens SB22]
MARKSDSPGKSASTKSEGEARPSAAQVELARLIAERHEVTLPLGFEADGPWTRKFLDVFAYDPEVEEDVFRRVRNIVQYVREGRDMPEMARKVGLRPDQVEFMISVLRWSDYDMEEVVEEFDTDPEDAAWRDMERDFEARAYEYH